MKKRALIYGAGRNFISQYKMISKYYNIIGVIDNSPAKQGTMICGHAVKDKSILFDTDYDVVLITVSDNKEIIEDLDRSGVPASKQVTLGSFYNIVYKNGRLNIALLAYGGVGDLIICKNWLHNLFEKYGLKNEKCDIFVYLHMLGAAKKVFGDSSFVNIISDIQSSDASVTDENNYDVVFSFCIVPFVQRFNGYAIAAVNRAFLDYILRLERFGFENYSLGFCHNPEYYKFIRRIIEMFPDKQYQNYCDLFGDFDIKENFIVSLPIDKNESEFLEKNGLAKNSYITISTGLNRDYSYGLSTRAWSHENWDRLSCLIKEKYPHLKTVQVGEKMSDDDNISADLNLNGKTDLDDVFILMKNAALHIDYEGGLVHIRHVLNGGPSVVLFGPTSVRRHSYPENISVKTDACPFDCEWRSSDWLRKCSEGYDKPLCMESVSPELVMDSINKLKL